MVHLAAHGYVRADNPLFSSLRLADGPLTVFDLERLERVAPTLVLAACDSGRPVVRTGDELLGFGASLLSLGAQQLVASVVAPHLAQRISFVVVAKSDPARIRAFADERGWRRLRLLSSRNNTYNRDYQAETPDGEQAPILNVFTRDGGGFRHWWATELMFAPRDEGEDPRHVDLIWPIWHVLDMTPGGRGSGEDVPAMQYE